MEEVREAAAKANALGFIESNEFGNFIMKFNEKTNFFKRYGRP